MFDKLVDLIVHFIDLFYFVRIVDEWEAGVVLRFGRYARSVGPGAHWVAPFGVERLITQDMYPVVAKLGAQSLTTADGIAAVVSAVVTWRAQNARKVLLECGGQEEALLDSATGVLAQHVTGANWSDLVTEEFRATVTSAVRDRAKKWGIKVLDVQLRDVARCRSLRLFGAIGLLLLAGCGHVCPTNWEVRTGTDGWGPHAEMSVGGEIGAGCRPQPIESDSASAEN